MNKSLINSRKILYPGRGDVPEYRDGTKVRFHFKAVKVVPDCDDVVIDDSKRLGKAMELIIGKQFKMILWEEWLKHMRVDEISQLVADRHLCTDYPFVSKCYRKYCRSDCGAGVDEDVSSHRCCAMAVKTGLGHEDLDELVANPSDIQFTIELLSVEMPEEYDKEVWQMTTDEMVASIPKYRSEGNHLYTKGQYSEAAVVYTKALSVIEQLLLKEKPGDEEWLHLDQLKTPLLSNLSQCRLIEKDFYAVIEYTTEVLNRDNDNIKALFRRAKAMVNVWDLCGARQDFQRVLDLDASLEKMVNKELKAIEVLEKISNKRDSDLLKGKLFS